MDTLSLFLNPDVSILMIDEFPPWNSGDFCDVELQLSFVPFPPQLEAVVVPDFRTANAALASLHFRPPTSTRPPPEHHHPACRPMSGLRKMGMERSHRLEMFSIAAAGKEGANKLECDVSGLWYMELYSHSARNAERRHI